MRGLILVLSLAISLSACTTASYQNPSDDGSAPEITVYLSPGSNNHVLASTNSSQQINPPECPLGTSIPFNQIVPNVIQNRERIFVSATDGDGIGVMLVTFVPLSGTTPPGVFDVEASGITSGTLSATGVPGAAQVRVDFEALAPTPNLTSRAVNFEVEFEEPFRIVTTVWDPNGDNRTLPDDGAPQSPDAIIFQNIELCQ